MKVPLALFVLVAAFICDGVSASDQDTAQQVPEGCGDTFWGCWFDDSGDACEPQSTANGCAFDYEASLQAVSLTQDDDGTPTLAGLIEDALAGDAAAVPWRVAKHVAKELCRIKGASSVSLALRGGPPASVTGDGVNGAQDGTPAASGDVEAVVEAARPTATYDCSRWFDVG